MISNKIDGDPLAFSTQRLIPSGNHGYIRNLGRFVQWKVLWMLKGLHGTLNVNKDLYCLPIRTFVECIVLDLFCLFCLNEKLFKELS